jgi:hypothetical protein
MDIKFFFSKKNMLVFDGDNIWMNHNELTVFGHKNDGLGESSTMAI